MNGLLDPEGTFVGALLHSDVDTARAAGALIHPEDLGDPQLAMVLRGAVKLAGHGVPPDPPAVLSLLRAEGTLTETAIHAVTDLLIDVYRSCPTPASVRWYAAAVLDEALRRRAVELADRIRQASAGPLDTLVQLVATEAAAVGRLQERRSAATREALPT